MLNFGGSKNVHGGFKFDVINVKSRCHEPYYGIGSMQILTRYVQTGPFVGGWFAIYHLDELEIIDKPAPVVYTGDIHCKPCYSDFSMGFGVRAFRGSSWQQGINEDGEEIHILGGMVRL